MANHDSGKVVWAAEGRSTEVLQAFFEQLGEEGRKRLLAASMDMGAVYLKATNESVPNARICLDPFHVIAMVNRAVDSVFSKATSARAVSSGWTVGRGASCATPSAAVAHDCATSNRS